MRALLLRLSALSALLIGGGGLIGCGGGGAADLGGPSQRTFESLQVTPTTASIAVGGSYPISATPMDEQGSHLTGMPAAIFTSSDPSKAIVTPAGLVTAMGEGTATITASVTFDGVTHTAACLVTITAAPIGGDNDVNMVGTSFVPPTITIAAHDSVTWYFAGAVHNVTFSAAAPAGGNIPDQTPGTSVSRTFETPGTYAYECTNHSNMTGTVVVQGAGVPVFTSVTVTPASPAIAVNGTAQLTAAALDQFGTALSGAPAPSFSSSNTGTATVSGAGLVTGKAAGSATITASFTVGGVTKSATATVTVTSPQSGGTTVTTPNLTFAPPSVTIAAGGTVTWQFSGALHNVSFGLNKPTGGNIPDQTVGNAVSRTFATPGTYTYECTNHSNMTGTVVVQGSAAPVFTSVTVTPASPAIAVNGTAQLTAAALDQFGTALSGAPAASFSSSNQSVAGVSGSGLVTGVAAGTASITASITAGGVTKTATSTVTVSSPQASDVSITTPNQTFSPKSVTVPAGTKVIWQFSGGTHNVTFSGAAPTGGNIGDQSSGNAVARTFTTAGTYSYNCTNHSGMNGTITVQGGTAPPPGTPPPPTPPPTSDIVVSTTAQATFAPEEVEIARGATVAWTFVGGTYNVTFKDQSPDGGSIPTQAPGATVSRTFTKSGDYDYYCSLHKDMKGRIRVN